jgi:mono/diheme cytochrome c family protein
MNSANRVLVGTGILCVAVATGLLSAERPTAELQAAPAPPAAAPARQSGQSPAPMTSRGPAAVQDHNAVVKQYCAGCHNERSKAGGLVLADFDMAKVTDHAAVGEKMILKLQAGMMPPPGSRRPEEAVLTRLVSTLESRIDAAATAKPNPGKRTFPRLNRAEYRRSIRELLNLDVDSSKWLPLDTMSANFDNIADEQALSPTLLESYLNAAADISRMAVGDRTAVAIDHTYTAPSYLSQHPWDHVEGTPYGTRGGMAVTHVFPADGEYVFEISINSGDNARYEDIDISVDGERVALLPYETMPAGGADGRGANNLMTEPVVVKAGQHSVAAAFVRRTEGPYEDLIRPHDWSFAGGGSGGGGITTLPHLRDLVVRGPYKTIGVSQTPSRAKIFSCRPTSQDEELKCAREIVTTLATEAYRRPVGLREVDGLMPFYTKGAAADGFEGGVRTSIEAILSSPHFIFRLERQPETVRAGNYRVSDLDLASRLSFFLWGTLPDKELLNVAAQGQLSNLAVLDKQTRRMLADPRADALGERFAAMWLRLQDIDKVKPDPNFYPNFDDNLAGMMRKETIMFFNNLVREDRSLMELYTANYSFMNERLARHYGILDVAGNDFRRVTYPDANRRGILGQGSMLVQTSMANRTSPVLRGKWVMEVLLGTPPPPPPPNVPDLEAAGEAKEGRVLTTRERMEIHRANPTCNACHRFMDPIGLSLDNFDVTGRWREREYGSALDPRGDYYDGTKISSGNELITAIMKRPTPIVRTFTENLMAYALGRRVEHFDQPTIRAIARKAETDSYKMSAFILGIVKSETFRMKSVDAAVATDESKAADRQ